MAKLREADLYAPIKAFLEAQGYEVKGEVAGADVVAMRADDPDPVIVELKLGMNLTLVQQGIARQGISDFVYLAVPALRGRKALAGHVGLCRRLGLGFMTVRARDGFVEVHCDPAPYAPRGARGRKGRLLREFQRRVGDPNVGGVNRVTIMTAYRQDAQRCAAYLAEAGPSKGAVVARATSVPRATTIMRDDHYGWFERVEKGVYALTPKGAEALAPE
ncbi:hypothetical protein DL237_17085 [Pseudooceanicola sediminis]|uniref:DUF2161 domain-containing phosphodiesterase n=1 Tax=Pseudooceanicola sediminis TaxID=2211117 RepID=A0A399IWH8_9RHOB|nr:DUF2161 family putative PD-(D/E)XK-type phosphodiesterase [Pseudooceanicola sediminis]KAA2312339.1 hypothetical protein E0K93_17325 [Puniceibacterium sp. HSS470]RII37391.1 hypothetical protein DL237_17085 [Pseudooceanicola sediminis]|tara:strand:- start:8094 stop:8747 length:654 start_codon:yes stop_codon:yes gene_type:complete